MLMLDRKTHERVVIDVTEPCRIVIGVGRIRRGAVQLGFDAPQSAKIKREELISEDVPELDAERDGAELPTTPQADPPTGTR